MTKKYSASIKIYSIVISLLFVSLFSISAQQDATFIDKSETLDIVTWNLQWFGAPQESYNASTFNQQLTSVSSVIQSLDADIYALQEVVNDAVNGYYLQKLVDQLNADTYSNKYIGYVSDRYSLYFKTPTTDYPSQCIAFIINTETVAVVDQYPMFKDLYNGYSTSFIEGYDGNPATFWSSGRLPYFLQGIASVNGVNEIIDFINIHAKCCDGSEDRRMYDSEYLLDAVNKDYALDNVVMLGDYNDDTNDGSPYDEWYADDELYFKEVAGEGIDHISVSNELYDEDAALSNNEYIETVSISDHDPVMVRLKLNNAKVNQVITLESIGDQLIGSVVDLDVVASSGLNVLYKVLYGDVDISNHQATFNTIGDYAIQAIQMGNDIYSAAFSNIITGAVLDEESGIEDEYAKKVKVFPNPCSNMVELKMPDSSLKSIDIYNITGAKVKSLIAYDAAKIDVNDLVNGLYFIQITTGNISVTKKIQVIH